MSDQYEPRHRCEDQQRHSLDHTRKGLKIGVSMSTDIRHIAQDVVVIIAYLITAVELIIGCVSDRFGLASNAGHAVLDLIKVLVG